MAKVELGGTVVPMFGFDRQKAIARDPKKKARRWAIRRYVVPSLTKEALGARIALMEAAIEMRGRSFEEVVTNVIEKCSGKDHGGKAKREALKKARYAAADKRLAEYKAML